MKERPIIFNAEMIRALLDGRKTMTRRPVMPQPFSDNPAGAEYIGLNVHNEHIWYPAGPISEADELAYEKDDGLRKCPFGVKGDRLWVQEKHFVLSVGNMDGTGREIIYSATHPEFPYGWEPAVSMPRWASRITLEVTGVRVERLQDITHKDALKEGVEYNVSMRDGAPIPRFRKLWDSIYANRGLCWDANPWVWVGEFERV